MCIQFVIKVSWGIKMVSCFITVVLFYLEDGYINFKQLDIVRNCSKTV